MEGRETDAVGVEVRLLVVQDAVVAAEALEEDGVRVERGVRDDGEILETHRIPILLEAI